MTNEELEEQELDEERRYCSDMCLYLFLLVATVFVVLKELLGASTVLAFTKRG